MSSFIPSKYQRLLFWDPEGRDSSCSAHRIGGEPYRCLRPPSKLLEKYTTPKKKGSWRQVVTCALTITMKLLTVKARWNIKRQSGWRVRGASPTSRTTVVWRSRRLATWVVGLFVRPMTFRGDGIIETQRPFRPSRRGSRPRRTAAPTTALPPARPRNEATAIWMFLITRRRLPLLISSRLLPASCGSWISTRQKPAEIAPSQLRMDDD